MIRCPVCRALVDSAAMIDDPNRTDLPCGCQDVHYDCGAVDYEHDHVECTGEPS